MAARMSPVEFYERDVRPRLSVEDVYRGVEFKSRRGRFWRGPCPLHGGTDPQNFAVDTETLRWRCWSKCQRGGSALAFLNGGETPRRADFVALVRKLADQVGVDTSPLDRPQSPEDEARHEAETRRAEMFERFLDQTRAALKDSPAVIALSYLEERRFTPEEIADSEFGFFLGPPEVEGKLRNHGFSRDELQTAGLLDPRWQGRLVFPWRDQTGRIVGFVARTVHEEEPKYLYSAGFRKADAVAFGLDVALRRGRREIVLVEGVLDVLRLQAKGVLNVAAIGGAGGEFSPARWKALEELGVRRVTLLLDNDEAGKDGTRKALDNLRNGNVVLKVDVVDPSLLGDAKDPDEYVRAYCVEALGDVLALAVPWAHYRARTLLGGVGPEAPPSTRQEAVGRVLDLVAGLRHETATLDREDVLRETAERTGYSTEALADFEEKRLKVRERADRERTLKAALREADSALTRGETPEAVLHRLKKEVSRLQAVTLEDPLPFDEERLWEESARVRAGRPSGWETLDRPEGDRGLGLRFNAGELALLAARPSHGKTSVLVGLLSNWLPTLSEDELVVFYSLEEPEIRIYQRLLALATYDTGGKWTVNQIAAYCSSPHAPTNGRDWPDTSTLQEARKWVQSVQNRLLVVFRPSWTVENLDAHVRNLAEKRTVSAVLVDYLQKLPPDKGGSADFDRRDIEVSSVGRRLKAIAVDLNVPVVAGAQINREAAKDKAKIPAGSLEDQKVHDAIRTRRPKLEQIREGGAEQEADLVLGLHNYRKDYEEDEDKLGNVLAVTDFEVGVLKNRYGAPGRWVTLGFEGQYHALRDKWGQ